MSSRSNTLETTMSPFCLHSSQARSSGLEGEYTTERSNGGRGGICTHIDRTETRTQDNSC